MSPEQFIQTLFFVLVGDRYEGLVEKKRGRGMFVAFDLCDVDTRQRFKNRMLDHGVLALGSGEKGIRFRPPLNLTPEVADEGLRRVRSAPMS